MSDHRFDWSRIILLALAVAGLMLSLTLVRMSAGEQSSDLLKWVCGESTTPGKSNCDKALESGFASVVFIPPRPVSTAAMGMTYFTTLGVWLLIVGRLPGKLHRFWLIPSLIGLLGLMVSAFFVYAMGSLLHSWCKLCLIVHILNVPLVLGIWGLWLAGPSRQSVEPSEQGTAVAATNHLWKIPVLALVVALAVSLAQIRDAQTSDAVRALEVESNNLDQTFYTNARQHDIPIDDDDPVLGPADAPHTVVIFSDLQCPACSRIVPILEDVQKDLAIRRASQLGKVVPAGHELDYAPFRMVFKHFPLNKTCNAYWKPLGAMEDHKYACEAAAAAEAARQLGGNDAFWKMHNAIYAIDQRDPAKLAGQPYEALAEQIGLDGDAFEQIRKDPATMERIIRDMKEGAQIGVRTTPSIFLDGRRIERSVKRDLQPPMQKTVEMWNHLLKLADIFQKGKAAGSQPAGLSRAEQAERTRRARAAAATQSAAAESSAPASEPVEEQSGEGE